MKIQILISKNSWANKYKKDIKKNLKSFSKNIFLLIIIKNLKKSKICILFSYFNFIEKNS